MTLPALLADLLNVVSHDSSDDGSDTSKTRSELASQILAQLNEVDDQEFRLAVLRLWPVMRHIDAQDCWTAFQKELGARDSIRAEIRESLEARERELKQAVDYLASDPERARGL